MASGVGVGCKSLEGAAVIRPADAQKPERMESPVPPPLRPAPVSERQEARSTMVSRQIAARGVDDERVLEAMRRVPRHRFVPSEARSLAYRDHPLPIGHHQTISQPYIVAYMTEALALRPEHKVLEIGTGSGYQAAVLAEVAGQVYTIEIVAPLAQQARATLDALGYTNIQFGVGDGYVGWPAAAPFNAIMLTASPPQIPDPLLDQLVIGGVMVAPVGRGDQELVRITRTKEGFDRRRVMGVRFVPMTGRAQED
jgi:protein-L-isoaspartate(D-aspartate) O-methyltransferase